MWLWVFFNVLEARAVKNHGRPKPISSNQVCFVWRIHKVRKKFGNHWVECRNPIDLMDCPSNVDIGLCWYEKWTNLQFYGSFHGRVKNKVCISCYSIHCILICLWVTSKGLTSLHNFMVVYINFIHYTYDRCSLLFKSIFVYSCQWLYMNNRKHGKVATLDPRTCLFESDSKQ